MPARYRMIGPETSEKVSEVIKRECRSRDWIPADLAQAVSARGYTLSTRTARQMQYGITRQEVIYPRMTTIDEIKALTDVFGRNFALAVFEIITEDSGEE